MLLPADEGKIWGFSGQNIQLEHFTEAGLLRARIVAHSFTQQMRLNVYIISPNITLVFKSIRACAGWKMDQRLTCTHSLLMGMRAATQSHRQPVKLLEGRTNVIPQLYQSHCWALGFITDQEGKTGKQEGDCGHGQWIYRLSTAAIHSSGE